MPVRGVALRAYCKYAGRVRRSLLPTRSKSHGILLNRTRMGVHYTLAENQVTLAALERVARVIQNRQHKMIHPRGGSATTLCDSSLTGGSASRSNRSRSWSATRGFFYTRNPLKSWRFRLTRCQPPQKSRVPRAREVSATRENLPASPSEDACPGLARCLHPGKTRVPPRGQACFWRGQAPQESGAGTKKPWGKHLNSRGQAHRDHGAR